MTRKHFVAMAGNIGSGKTTAAKLISQSFGFELFDEPVVDNRFLKDYYADMRRWSFTLQLEFLIRRAEHHELIKTVNKSCIQDRTLWNFKASGSYDAPWGIRLSPILRHQSGSNSARTLTISAPAALGLTATSALVSVSVARYTTAKAPLPRNSPSL